MMLQGSNGGKGGGGSVRLPHEDANTLQSRAYARFVDLIGDGPWEGFCTEDNITCKDAEFKISNYADTTASNSFRIQSGALYFDPAVFPTEGDNVICRIISGATSTALVSESSGYPSSWANQIRCTVEGDGSNADILVSTYPKNVGEQTASIISITQLSHGFVVGNRVQKVGTIWQLVSAPVYDGEIRVVTGVTNANTFSAGLDIFPEGRVRGIKIQNAGKNYTWARVHLPSTVLQAIEFDDQPLANPLTLQPNFKDVRLEYRYGTEDQTTMPGFEQVEEILEVDGAFESAEVHHEEVHTKDAAGAMIVQTYLPKSRLLSGPYDRLVIDFALFDGFYVQNIKTGDIESVGSASQTTLRDYNAFLTSYIDYTVTVKIEQRFKKVSDPESISSRQWYPFGRGFYVFAGKTMSPYVRSIEAPLMRPEPNEKYQWEIRVTRLTYDDADYRRSGLSEERRPFTKFRVERVTAVTNVKLTYPFSVLVGIEINAEQFSRMPVRAYRMKMLRVQVPTNYFPPYTVREVFNSNGSITRTIREFPEYNRDPITGLGVYDSSGQPVEQSWDGTFYEAWTNNPAWIAYAVCTDTRYGLGRHIQTTSKWKHYQIARYCDEVVMTGFEGGTYGSPECRYTAGMYVQAKQEAHKFLSDVASTFSGFYFFSGGAVVPVQERPRATRMSFTPADVENGLFEYRGTQRRVRHTISTVKFNDPDNKYNLTPVGYEDDEGILRYGIQTIDKTAWACISRGQARRFAKKIIRMETSNTDTVSFVAGIKASILIPGDVIAIYDPVRSSLPYGGRILAVNRDSTNRTSLVLDRWFEIDPAMPAGQFSIQCSNPTRQISEEEIQTAEDADRLLMSQVETFQISAFSRDDANHRVVIINTSLPEGVKVGGVWGLRSSNVEPQLFSVLGIEELSKHKYTVTALEYHEALFAEVDSDVPYSETSINPDLEGWKNPYPIRNLLLDVTTKIDQGITVFTLNASWSKPERGFGLEYEVWLQKGLGNYQFVTTTKNTHADFRLSEPDNYCVRIFAIGLQGRRSTAVSACTVIGSLDGTNAEIISGLEIKGQANNTTFESDNVEFDWRVNWSEATSEFQTGEPPILPPRVLQYEIEIYNTNNVKVGFFVVSETNFTLSMERNRSLTGGPYREFIISVRARTDDGGLSAATQLRVKNDRPTAPAVPPSPDYTLVADTDGNAVLTLKNRTGTCSTAGKAVTGLTGDSFVGMTGSIFINGILYTIASVTDATHLTLKENAGEQTGSTWAGVPFPDFAGVKIWISLTSGFVPDLASAKSYENDQVIIPLTLNQTNYIRWAYYDTICANNLDCNISAEYAIIPNKEGRLSVFDFMPPMR